MPPSGQPITPPYCPPPDPPALPPPSPGQTATGAQRRHLRRWFTLFHYGKRGGRVEGAARARALGIESDGQRIRGIRSAITPRQDSCSLPGETRPLNSGAAQRDGTLATRAV